MMANSSTNRQDYTLYVTNIPEELNDNGIRAIFDHYGEISSLFYRSGTNWAYITYKCYSEAENAMRDLNNVPPLRLKLRIAREKSSNKKDASINNNNSFYIKHTELRSDIGNTVHTQAHKPISEDFECTTKNGSVYSYAESAIPTTFNKDVADASANALWTRGQVTVTDDGKRHVSLGRGYKLYEIPNPHPHVEDQIQRVCEKRYPGLYQYGKDTLDSQIGKCANCSSIAKHKCQRCHEFYCSQECQIADWPKHKAECIPVPGLIPVTDSLSVSSPKVEGKTPSRRTCAVQMPLRPPKHFMQQNGDILIKEDYDQRSIPEKVETRPCEMNEPIVPKLNTQSPVVVQQVKTPVEKSENNYNVAIQNANKIDETISFQTPTFLSKTKYTDVKIVMKVNDREYWVQKNEDDDALTNLVINLQDEVEKSSKVLPKVGNIYAAKFEDLWYRCSVISLRPLKVHFVDYGNNIILPDDDIRECKTFQNVPHFSGKVRLPQNVSEKYKNLKEEDTLFVRALSIDKDMVINVEIQGESEKQSRSADNSSMYVAPSMPRIETKPSPPKVQTKPSTPMIDTKPSENLGSSLTIQEYLKLPKMLSTMDIGDQGMLEINDQLNSTDYGATILPYYLLSKYKKEIDQMQAECNQVSQTPQDSTGVLVCGKQDDEWLRGYVISNSVPYKVASIDKGNIVTVQKIVPCPTKYKTIPAAGVVCNINMPTKLNGQQGHFKVTGREGDQDSLKLEIEVSLASAKVKAILTIFKMQSGTTPKGVQFAKLKNNSQVFITAYRNQGMLYLCSLEPNHVESHHNTMQAVAKCALTAQSLKELPSIGQLIIAPFVDGNYYRAIVQEVKEDKVCVFYMDYGNSDYVSPAKLKELPDELQNLPSCVSKVILKDVPCNVPITKDVDDYLTRLVGNEVPLTYSVEDGAVLKDSNGQIVNVKINELLIPNWKRNKGHDDKTCYMMSDLKVIPLGNVGDTVMAYVLQNLEHKQYMLCTYTDVISYIQEVLPIKMKEYCESTEHYIPRDEELCLVRFKGQWCRAVCICRDKTPNTTCVFMVDRGNIEDIEHTDIRVMTKDFMAPDALASICTVHNLAPKNENDEYSAAVQERLSKLIENDKPIKVKILKASDDGSYEIEFPEVREILIRESLIQN